MGIVTKFSLGEEEKDISSDKSFGTTAWITPNDAVHRLYQGLIYFQNVTQFQGTCINVISFMLISKVQPLHDSFPLTHNVVSSDSAVSIATRYKLDGPGIETRPRGRVLGRFSTPIYSRPGTQPAPTKRVPRLFPRSNGSKLKQF